LQHAVRITPPGITTTLLYTQESGCTCPVSPASGTGPRVYGLLHSKNKGTTGVLATVPLGAILVPLGYHSKKSKSESP
jgi:hypothetical protein